jgi:hypothetical protein
MQKRHGDWIQTHTLRQYWPLDPRPEDISIMDIGHALSMICRFTGHVHAFYSVAEHSVRVSTYLSAGVKGLVTDEEALELARWGLLHDADEAYLTDVARPVKRSAEMQAYREAAKRNLAAVCQRFGLSLEEPPAVKAADNRLCYTEARDLFPGVHSAWRWHGVPLHERLRPHILWIFAPLMTGLLRLALWTKSTRACSVLLRARLQCGIMSPTGAKAAFRARFLELFHGEAWR